MKGKIKGKKLFYTKKKKKKKFQRFSIKLFKKVVLV